jgi:hypothetical protein
MLMLVGVEFGPDQLPRERVRDAIRIMPEDMRVEAAAWVASYLAHPSGDEDQQAGADYADKLWEEKVWPWLKRVWPSEPQLRSRGVSSQFARAAIATGEQFPLAVAALSTQFVHASADLAVLELMKSNHPDRHPKATLELLNAIVDPAEFWHADEILGALGRIRVADPEIADTGPFRVLLERIRIVQ